ncbi:hypothetical protein ACVFYP_27470 [Roseomonas sp. F4]
MAAWTDVELRAIAEGDKAADSPGLIPAGLTGADQIAWRAGFARGWNGLGESARAEGHPKAPFKAGWQAGFTIAKAAARGYEEARERLEVALALLDCPWATWSSVQRDAFEDGVECGRRGLIPTPTLRYRGRLREQDAIWWLGWRDGFAIMTGKAAQVERHPVTEPSPVGIALSIKTEDSPRPPRSGVERQRAYRTRRKTRSIDIGEETYELLRRLCQRNGCTVNDALRLALQTVLTSGYANRSRNDAD